MSYSSIKLATSGHTAVIAVSRASALNALNSVVLDELDAALAEVRADKDCRALIITGEGEKAFVAGADIAEMRDLGPDEAVSFARRGQAVFRAIEELPIPVIAAVNGMCIGGGLDIISACDIRLCAEDASFSLREAAIGFVADMGVLQRLPHIIGQGFTREMAYTARFYSAREVERMGLVNGIYPDKEALFAEAGKLAGQIAATNPNATFGGALQERSVVTADDHQRLLVLGRQQVLQRARAAGAVGCHRQEGLSCERRRDEDGGGGRQPRGELRGQVDDAHVGASVRAMTVLRAGGHPRHARRWRDPGPVVGEQ